MQPTSPPPPPRQPYFQQWQGWLDSVPQQPPPPARWERVVGSALIAYVVVVIAVAILLSVLNIHAAEPLATLTHYVTSVCGALWLVGILALVTWDIRRNIPGWRRSRWVWLALAGVYLFFLGYLCDQLATFLSLPTLSGTLTRLVPGLMLTISQSPIPVFLFAPLLLYGFFYWMARLERDRRRRAVYSQQ